MVHNRRLVSCAVFVVVASTQVGCVLISGNLDPFSREKQPLAEHVVDGSGKAKILLLDITRVISSEADRGVFGIADRESVVARVESELRRAAEDDNVKGVIVRLNTPGGTVTASDVLYERITSFKRERKVPVVALLMDIATSGGYYTALAADQIVAHPTTVTGSVGVIFQGINLSGLLEKIGVEDQTVKTGDKKDIGSPLRTMTVEERALLQRVLGDMQQRFLGLVRERRPHVTNADAIMIADGRIFTATQALDLGLVDSIGYLDDSIQQTKTLAGISDARIVMYRRPNELAESLYSTPSATSSSATPQINLFSLGLDASRLDPRSSTPRFLYLWAP